MARFNWQRTALGEPSRRREPRCRARRRHAAPAACGDRSPGSSASADAAGAGNYSRCFDATLLPELRELPGFNGACLLRRDVGEDGAVELTTHTFWESPEVIRAFAGRTATHRSLVVDARD